MNFSRASAMLLLLLMILSISFYGQMRPPVKEMGLREFKTMKNAGPVIFQHYPVKAVSVSPDGTVFLRDMFGAKLACIAIPSIEAHPAVQKVQWLNVELQNVDGTCQILRSAPASGFRAFKLAVSALALLSVIVLFLVRFRFDFKQMVILPRDRSA
jgi:hypothetical protein